MSVDVEELRRLAEAATAGPWSTKQYGPDHVEVLLPNGFSRVISDPTVVTDYDARFIAAANPSAVLALLERVRRLEDAARGVLKWTDFKDTDEYEALEEALKP